MAGTSGKVHVVRVSKTGYVDKQGRRKDYTSAYLRRTYRDGGTVKNETVANLSALPDHVIDLIDAGLKGRQLVPAAEVVTITRSLPHGHVAAVHAMARTLGLPALLGPAGRQRDLALALIISRVAQPGSKLSTLTWWADTTLGGDLGVAEASTDDIYAAMDWLEHRQDAIEAKLAARPGQPGRPGPTVRGRPAKASYQHDPAGQPYRSFRGLLEHLATLSRNQVRFAGTTATVPMLANRPAPSGRPSSSSAPRSRSP